MTLAKINKTRHENVFLSETCRSNFSVYFNVNFNILLNKYIVHPLVKLKDFDNIKMHGITMKKGTVVLKEH